MIIIVALLLVGLLPRILGLADFFTTDEAYHWIERVDTFSDALADHNWNQTNQTGHPGVTLMWLGSGGLALERVAQARGWIASPTPLEHLAWLRLPSAILEALCIPLLYLLLRRLVDPTTALIAALLCATSPYLIAHARLLHLDALLTSFATFSIVLLLIATTDQRPPSTSAAKSSTLIVGGWALIASGIALGLALLTKGPALILLPICGLLLLWSVPANDWWDRIRRTAAMYIVWVGVALLIVVLVWPALWVNPGRALHSYVEEITSNGGRPNGDGQFFFGQAVADPGALFYPVADVFRMTPLMCVGLLALLGGTIYDALRRPTNDDQPRLSNGNNRFSLFRVLAFRLLRPTSRDGRTLLALGVFVLLWTLVMTVGPKKFDRYVLPTWPTLLVLAAAGWTRLLHAGLHVSRRCAQSSFVVRRSNVLAVLGFALLALVEISQPLLVHPYYLSYYNPLLGGGAVAQRVLLIGWGEGMDRVGSALRARPDIDQAPVLSALAATLRPFVPVPVRDVDTLDKTKANYAVVYLESTQRNANPEMYGRIEETEPVARVTIHGIDYALIYQLPKSYDHAVDARFNNGLHLRGVTVAQSAGQLVVTPSWDVRSRPETDCLVFLHLIDAHGQRVAQVDVAPGGDRPMNTWQAGEQLAVPLSIALPNTLAPGTYQLVLGMYDPASGARLPFTGATPADPTHAGPNAVLLDTLTLP